MKKVAILVVFVLLRFLCEAPVGYCANYAYGDLVSQQTLGFDDIGETPYHGEIPNGYGGFSWLNLGYLNTTYPKCQSTGYAVAATSGDYVAYAQNVVVSITGETFDWISAYFTAVIDPNLEIKCQGWREDVLLYETSLFANANNPILVMPEFLGIDRLSITSIGGSSYWAMDDFTTGAGTTPAAPVPEPATMILFGSGLVILAGRARARKFFKK
jgi:hypothetical protein